MTAPDMSADEKASVARFGIHEVGDGLPVVRVERDPSADDRARVRRLLEERTEAGA